MTLVFRNRNPLPALFSEEAASRLARLSPRPERSFDAQPSASFAPDDRELLDGRLGVSEVPPELPEEVFTEYVFPIAGQGTIAFTITPRGPFRIILSGDKTPSSTDPVLVLDVGEKQTCFRKRNDQKPDSIIEATTAKDALLRRDVALTYWFSLDTQNRTLRFGLGEMLPALCVFEARLPPRAAGQEIDPYAYIAKIRHVALSGTPVPVPSDDFLWPVPVTVGLPGLVVPTDRITLDDIAANRCTTIANLDQASQVLYGTVAGAGITLDTADFPEFSAAIDRSIMTPGLWCFEKLKSKAEEFGGKPDPLKTYLRITIGPNQGDSPGSPYVLEIWPGGHYSPIHNHGKASAIIKVLHGQIWVELYPQLSPQVLDYYVEAAFQQGDVTFLSPRFYQVHKLINRNPPGRMTATIQCYRYPEDDTRHYEYFDYLDGNNAVQHFQPDSDSEFAAFKSLMRKEWAAR
ncbi:hypothetical protein [Chondromyces crocatus]|uniref:Cysteine dioxygenase n=1 Tax=Chondromyces crocatus TaxID=52 RepID=A0A0K1ENJ7_CHOCO|nr:hypothetical protein [Chondromyces crocatus]AKT42168.1 uncharacterized protein CMC5_063910 [Chondromyces crocatus]